MELSKRKLTLPHKPSNLYLIIYIYLFIFIFTSPLEMLLLIWIVGWLYKIKTKNKKNPTNQWDS